MMDKSLLGRNLQRVGKRIKKGVGTIFERAVLKLRIRNKSRIVMETKRYNEDLDTSAISDDFPSRAPKSHLKDAKIYECLIS